MITLYLDRQHRTANERRRVAVKRDADPVWWQDYLCRNAAYRRLRAANDPAYRRQRNKQAK